MKIFPANFNPSSDTGPNTFTRNMFNFLCRDYGVTIEQDITNSNIEFCLIQSQIKKTIPRVTRLDGIYFNKSQDFNQLNNPILSTYKDSDAVIFQSMFNKVLIESWFGEHNNSHVILNGADTERIEKISKADLSQTFPNKKIWMCASSWRPHKRLNENIRYFIENSDSEDVLLIAGKGVTKEDFFGYENIVNSRIFYIGHVEWSSLISLYKASEVFIHLSFLDHCPNVVVDAAACGCEIVCSDAGGTKEIYAKKKTIISDLKWDFKPLYLYEPPPLDFDARKNIESEENFDISNSANLYYKAMKEIL